jgi:endonuclease-8
VPEGDTVAKLASVLSEQLRGQRLDQVCLKRLDGRCLVGRVVAQVESHGKHLLLSFNNGLVLRSHLGLHGSWHSYAKTERWRKSRHQASILLGTQTRLFVCFSAREVEILLRDGFRLDDRLHRLGPDLAGKGLDLDQVQRRATELAAPHTPLVDLLLDQRIAAGIGNVYKSEVLFLEGFYPLLPLAALSPGVLRRMYQRAAGLLRRNLGGGPRVTRFVPDDKGILWVYGRAGLPCLSCGEKVLAGRLGAGLRSTYWCPSCQPDCRLVGAKPPP